MMSYQSSPGFMQLAKHTTLTAWDDGSPFHNSWRMLGRTVRISWRRLIKVRGTLLQQFRRCSGGHLWPGRIHVTVR